MFNKNELRNKEYVGEAGGGMVKVVMNGNYVISSAKIDHEVFANSVPAIFDDLDFLSDLFVAATNQAIDKAIDDISESLSKSVSVLPPLK